MKTVRYELVRDLPLLHEAEVLVVGGGPGGIGAAVMAARCGADTLLVERYGFLGGMAVAGEVHPFMPNHLDGEPLDQPVYTEWVAKMREIWQRDDITRQISKDAALLAAEELCLEAGVRILYHHHLADAVVSDRRIEWLVLFSKSGLTAARARIYIDCTGDGDLAARAGCEYEQGGPTGYCQPMTLCFKLSHVDKRRMPSREEINRLYAEARERGEIECVRDNVLWFPWLEEDVIHFNTTRVIHKNGTSGVELSEAEQEGHRQVREFLNFFRKHVPGFEKAQIHSIAHHIGVRETRRILGMAYLEGGGVDNAAKFDDAIARVRYPIDIHNPDGGGTIIAELPEGEWYEIPYGCIVPKDIDNLLVGGRPISVDHAIHSSMRVMPSACSVGQAAGLAAALAVERNCAPRELSGREVR
ncbi:MAG: FAD-dependent oxidoreductase, partial [Kiritimatiellae bacterium]|nr:FAD-dependent oxidoreductase [Kiritimatiellia bacterium]